MAYIHRTNGTETNELIWTFSCWVKKSDPELGAMFGFAAAATNTPEFSITSNDYLQFWTSGASIHLATDALYQDPGAWYHIVLAVDTTQGTPADRVNIYVNGTQITDFSTETYPGSSYNSEVNKSGEVLEIGKTGGTGLNGVMSHVHFVDGTQYTASTFGETDATSGIWKIKTSPTVTYGNNGFFLKMEDRTNLDLDSSPNAHTMTTSGTLTATYDSPSNNFATLNPLIVDGGGATTYSNGNTTAAETANQWTSSHSTLAVGASKWYFESEFTLTTSTEGYIGAASVPAINEKSSADFYLGITNGSVGYLAVDGTIYNGSGAESYGDSYTTGDIIGVALDITNGKIYYSKNGTWQNSGDPAAGTNGFSLGAGMTSGADICLSVSPNQSYWECNFGNGYFGTTSSGTTEADDAGIGQFKYDVPTGFYALCTKNIKAYGG